MFHSLLRSLGLYQSHSEYDKWHETLKLRNQKEWEKQWHEYQIDASFFITLACILSLPNHYRYPSDKLSLVLFNRFADLSDVEAILYIEDQFNIIINMDEVSKGLSLADLMPIQL